jgi:hypothetical protein
MKKIIRFVLSKLQELVINNQSFRTIMWLAATENPVQTSDEMLIVFSN